MKPAHFVRHALCLAVLGALTACNGTSSGAATSGTPSSNTPAAGTPVPANIVSPAAGYTISVFATNPAGSSKPDDIVPLQTAAGTPDSAVFIAYQDRSSVDPMGNIPTGAPSGTVAQGQVVEYDLNGNILQTLNVPGHIDGMLQYTANNYHTLWISSDEDANPKLSVVDLSTSPATVTTYTPDAASLSTVAVTDPDSSASTTNYPLRHGGGMDDLKLINGNVYVSASAPATTTTPANGTTATYSTSYYDGASCGAGVCNNSALYGVNQAVTGTVNTNGAIQYLLSLNTGSSNTFHVTPVVSTDGATTPTTMLSTGTTALTSNNNAAVLNATDADSTALDPNGDLWIDSQQDAELIHVIGMNPATATQTTAVLPLTYAGTSWAVDDFRWVPMAPAGATGNTFMLVTDTTSGYVYRIDATSGFTPGQVFTSGGGMIASLNMTTGILTPLFVNFQATHGLNFVTP